MTAIITIFKKIFATPLLLIILIPLIILALPFLIIAALLSIPFGKKRLRSLPKILKNDWEPKQKFIYIGLTSGYELADYIKSEIIPKNKQHIIWDEWDTERGEWNESEPDTTKRVTTFWQDIGGDFDGEPMIIVATYTPGDYAISKDSNNFHQFFFKDKQGKTIYNTEELNVEDAKKKVAAIVKDSLAAWKYKG